MKKNTHLTKKEAPFLKYKASSLLPVCGNIKYSRVYANLLCGAGVSNSSGMMENFVSSVASSSGNCKIQFTH